MGKIEPSQTHRLGMSQLRQSALTTLSCGVNAHARRAGKMIGVVLLPEDVFGAHQLQAVLHLAERVLDQRLVIVAPAIGDAGNAQPVWSFSSARVTRLRSSGSISPTIFSPT